MWHCFDCGIGLSDHSSPWHDPGWAPAEVIKSLGVCPSVICHTGTASTVNAFDTKFSRKVPFGHMYISRLFKKNVHTSLFRQRLQVLAWVYYIYITNFTSPLALIIDIGSIIFNLKTGSIIPNKYLSYSLSCLCPIDTSLFLQQL
jgi:hypothetical protein